MATLKLENINKIYPNKVQAVFDFNLDIEDKEFIVFVGPSGCGKSTTLRMIAGLEDISNGSLFIDDLLVNDLAPKNRSIAMVFQSYALYPHMSVYDNMAFGLQIKKMDKKLIDEKVKEAARVLEIEQYLDRKPKELSGGQRQRVALGRAIVSDAKVYLMDEPLSNLDAKLRVQMRSEIIKLHERVGATTVYVTHDQTEAMTMASRIVVMKDGYIQQIGTPSNIYDNPANIFVASFIGAPATNFFDVKIEGNMCCINNKKFIIPQMYMDEMKNYDNKEVVLGVRPEDLYYEGIVKETYPTACLDYDIDVMELLGHECILHGLFENQKCLVKISTRYKLQAKQKVQLTLDLGKIHFFDKETTNKIV